MPIMPKCSHINAITKTYVGSSDTYQLCLDCGDTFGGEETPAKKALIQAAAEAEERVLNEALDLAKSGDLDAIDCANYLQGGRLVAATDAAALAAESFDVVGDADRAETARWLVEEIDSLT